MKMKTLSFALCCALSTSSFAKGVVVFGDSLSDIGQTNWNKKASYLNAQGQYHALYNEILNKALGGDMLKASTQGGTNYAYSGGVIVGTNSKHTTTSTSQQAQPNVELGKQIETYLQSSPQKEALHILWGGGNDFATILTQAVSKPDAEKQAFVLTEIQKLATTLAKDWAKLRQAGINTVIIPTVPNVVSTPEFFNQLGEVASKKIKQQASETLTSIPLLGSVLTSLLDSFKLDTTYKKAFEKSVKEILSKSTGNSDEFEKHRLETLQNSAENFLKKLNVVAKSGFVSAGYNAEKIADLLIGQYSDVAQQAKFATAILNSRVTEALNQVGGNIIRIDAEGLLKDMIARPKDYGINNTTDVACPNSTATAEQSCTPQDPTVADGRLFADSFHPGPKAHKAMADYILNVLQTPKDMGLLAQLTEQHTIQAADFARIESNRNRFIRQTPQTVQALAAYQVQPRGRNLYVGTKIQLTDQWQLLVNVGQQQQSQQQGKVKATLNNHLINTTLRYDKENWWVGSALQLNSGKLTLHRIAQLGQALHSQSAETETNSFNLQTFAGYEWQWDNLFLALNADINKTHLEISGFGEKNIGITQMQFSEQKRRSLKSGLGVDLHYQSQNWLPYVSARWIKEWNKNIPTIKATLNGSSFETILEKSDRAWGNLRAGVQFNYNQRFFANLSASRDIGRKTKHKNDSIQFGISFHF
ncbi:autotransporter domain-containing protein [[Haemophilus] felis]|nr:autotransporter domain-containing protein [[Haemophilus] felis]